MVAFVAILQIAVAGARWQPVPALLWPPRGRALASAHAPITPTRGIHSARRAGYVDDAAGISTAQTADLAANGLLAKCKHPTLLANLSARYPEAKVAVG